MNSSQKLIRVGNTELQLLVIKQLLDLGFAVPEYHLKNYLKYIWTTAGWYDINHIPPLNKNDFTWSRDYTSQLDLYCETYRNALINSDVLYIMPSMYKLMEGIVSETISEHQNQEIFIDNFIIGLKVKMVKEFFPLNQIFESLKGMKILIISPFADLFKQQIDNGNAYNITPALRDSCIHFISYPYCFNNLGPNENTFATIDSWLQLNLKFISEFSPSCVIAANGSAGPIILDKLPNFFSKAYTGADLQLKFGVLGNRWKESILSSDEFKNTENSWILKIPDEFIPNNAEHVENACYW